MKQLNLLFDGIEIPDDTEFFLQGENILKEKILKVKMSLTMNTKKNWTKEKITEY